MTYLFLAYAAVFLGLGSYLVMIGRKNRELKEQIDALEQVTRSNKGNAF